MERVFVVLYTHQKTKKAKTWQDGTLKVHMSQNRAILYDEKKSKLDALYVRQGQVCAGEELESDRYLIQVEEPLADLPSMPIQTPPASCPSGPVPRTAVFRSGAPTLRQPCYPEPADRRGVAGHAPPDTRPTSAPPSTAPRPGIKRKRGGFIPPRQVKMARTDPAPIEDSPSMTALQVLRSRGGRLIPAPRMPPGGFLQGGNQGQPSLFNMYSITPDTTTTTTTTTSPRPHTMTDTESVSMSSVCRPDADTTRRGDNNLGARIRPSDVYPSHNDVSVPCHPRASRGSSVLENVTQMGNTRSSTNWNPLQHETDTAVLDNPQRDVHELYGDNREGVTRDENKAPFSVESGSSMTPRSDKLDELVLSQDTRGSLSTYTRFLSTMNSAAGHSPWSLVGKRRNQTEDIKGRPQQQGLHGTKRSESQSEVRGPARTVKDKSGYSSAEVNPAVPSVADVIHITSPGVTDSPQNEALRMKGVPQDTSLLGVTDVSKNTSIDDIDVPQSVSVTSVSRNTSTSVKDIPCNTLMGQGAKRNALQILALIKTKDDEQSVFESVQHGIRDAAHHAREAYQGGGAKTCANEVNSIARKGDSGDNGQSDEETLGPKAAPINIQLSEAIIDHDMTHHPCHNQDTSQTNTTSPLPTSKISNQPETPCFELNFSPLSHASLSTEDDDECPYPEEDKHASSCCISPIVPPTVDTETADNTVLNIRRLIQPQDTNIRVLSSLTNNITPNTPTMSTNSAATSSTTILPTGGTQDQVSDDRSDGRLADPRKELDETYREDEKEDGRKSGREDSRMDMEEGDGQEGQKDDRQDRQGYDRQEGEQNDGPDGVRDGKQNGERGGTQDGKLFSKRDGKEDGRQVGEGNDRQDEGRDTRQDEGGNSRQDWERDDRQDGRQVEEENDRQDGDENGIPDREENDKQDGDENGREDGEGDGRQDRKGIDRQDVEGDGREDGERDDGHDREGDCSQEKDDHQHRESNGQTEGEDCFGMDGEEMVSEDWETTMEVMEDGAKYQEGKGEMMGEVGIEKDGREEAVRMESREVGCSYEQQIDETGSRGICKMGHKKVREEIEGNGEYTECDGEGRVCGIGLQKVSGEKMEVCREYEDRIDEDKVSDIGLEKVREETKEDGEFEDRNGEDKVSKMNLDKVMEEFKGVNTDLDLGRGHIKVTSNDAESNGTGSEKVVADEHAHGRLPAAPLVAAGGADGWRPRVAGDDSQHGAGRRAVCYRLPSGHRGANGPRQEANPTAHSAIHADCGVGRRTPPVPRAVINSPPVNAQVGVRGPPAPSAFVDCSSMTAADNGPGDGHRAAHAQGPREKTRANKTRIAGNQPHPGANNPHAEWKRGSRLNPAALCRSDSHQSTPDFDSVSNDKHEHGENQSMVSPTSSRSTPVTTACLESQDLLNTNRPHRGTAIGSNTETRCKDQPTPHLTHNIGPHELSSMLTPPCPFTNKLDNGQKTDLTENTPVGSHTTPLLGKPLQGGLGDLEFSPEIPFTYRAQPLSPSGRGRRGGRGAGGARGRPLGWIVTSNHLERGPQSPPRCDTARPHPETSERDRSETMIGKSADGYHKCTSKTLKDGAEICGSDQMRICSYSTVRSDCDPLGINEDKGKMSRVLSSQGSQELELSDISADFPSVDNGQIGLDRLGDDATKPFAGHSVMRSGVQELSADALQLNNPSVKSQTGFETESANRASHASYSQLSEELGSVSFSSNPIQSPATDLDPVSLRKIMAVGVPEQGGREGGDLQYPENTGTTPNKANATIRCPDNSANILRSTDNLANAFQCPDNLDNALRCLDQRPNALNCPANPDTVCRWPNSSAIAHRFSNNAATYVQCPNKPTTAHWCPENKAVGLNAACGMGAALQSPGDAFGSAPQCMPHRASIPASLMAREKYYNDNRLQTPILLAQASRAASTTVLGVPTRVSRPRELGSPGPLMGPGLTAASSRLESYMLTGTVMSETARRPTADTATTMNKSHLTRGDKVSGAGVDESSLYRLDEDGLTKITRDSSPSFFSPLQRVSGDNDSSPSQEVPHPKSPGVKPWSLFPSKLCESAQTLNTSTKPPEILRNGCPIQVFPLSGESTENEQEVQRSLPGVSWLGCEVKGEMESPMDCQIGDRTNSAMGDDGGVREVRVRGLRQPLRCQPSGDPLVHTSYRTCMPAAGKTTAAVQKPDVRSRLGPKAVPDPGPSAPSPAQVVPAHKRSPHILESPHPLWQIPGESLSFLDSPLSTNSQSGLGFSTLVGKSNPVCGDGLKLRPPNFSGSTVCNDGPEWGLTTGTDKNTHLYGDGHSKFTRSEETSVDREQVSDDVRPQTCLLASINDWSSTQESAEEPLSDAGSSQEQDGAIQYPHRASKWDAFKEGDTHEDPTTLHYHSRFSQPAPRQPRPPEDYQLRQQEIQLHDAVQDWEDEWQQDIEITKSAAAEKSSQVSGYVPSSVGNMPFSPELFSQEISPRDVTPSRLSGRPGGSPLSAACVHSVASVPAGGDTQTLLPPSSARRRQTEFRAPRPAGGAGGSGRGQSLIEGSCYITSTPTGAQSALSKVSSSANMMHGELRFPSQSEVETTITPQRQATIPASFSSAALYRQALINAIREHLNLLLFDVARRYHATMSRADTTGYDPGSDIRPNNGQMTEGIASSSNPPCRHDVPSKRVQVRKAGPNQGRFFFACASERGQQCGFFKWAELASKSGGRGQSTAVTLSDSQSITSFLRGAGVRFYCEGQLIRKAANSYRQNMPQWMRRKMGQDEASKPKKLYLGLPRKEASSAYAKEDLWVLSPRLDFDPAHSLVVRTTFFGPNQAMHLEIDPIGRYCPSNWPNGAFCHAIHTVNASTELGCIANIEESVKPATLPILPHLLNRVDSQSQETSAEERFSAPRTCYKPIFFVPGALVDSMADEMIDKYRLNVDQAEALRRIAAMFASERTQLQSPITLIHGVFGAGKSYLLAVVVLFLVQLFAENDVYTPDIPDPLKILISSTTNVAVDRILLGLLDMGHDDFVRVGSVKKIAKPILPYSVHAAGSDNKELTDLQDMLKSQDLTPAEKIHVRRSIDQYRKGANKKRLKKVRIVGVTCAACAFQCLQGFNFSVVLLDECSQMTEPMSLLPIAKFGCHKLVLVGDPKQLDPTIQGSEPSHNQGLEQTLFDRLTLMGHKAVMLRTQYRCHPLISAIPNALFYGLQLQNGISASDRPPLLGGWPSLCFLDVRDGCEKSTASGSFYNDREADLVVALIDRLTGQGVQPSAIGVITLYRGQQARIVDLLNCSRSDLKGIQVSTVDAFQGGEREVIFLSCVRTHFVGFIDSDKRTNVALSRAKNHLYIVGHRKNLHNNPLWRKVIKHCCEAPQGMQVGAEFLKRLENAESEVSPSGQKTADTNTEVPLSEESGTQAVPLCDSDTGQFGLSADITLNDVNIAERAGRARKKVHHIDSAVFSDAHCSDLSDSDDDLPTYL